MVYCFGCISVQVVFHLSVATIFVNSRHSFTRDLNFQFFRGKGLTRGSSFFNEGSCVTR